MFIDAGKKGLGLREREWGREEGACNCQCHKERSTVSSRKRPRKADPGVGEFGLCLCGGEIEPELFY